LLEEKLSKMDSLIDSAVASLHREHEIIGSGNERNPGEFRWFPNRSSSLVKCARLNL
jgi:hypothetical protein